MNRITPSAPQIGFDRFIRLEWAAAALRVRAEFGSESTLCELLDNADLGAVALKKTRSVLNRLWLHPRPDLIDFADRGARIFKADPSVSVTALTWGMATVTYPFFARVAEIVGRLSALQGDCAAAEVHRRMSEHCGERQGTRRMTNMVLQSQAHWKAIDRVAKGNRIARQDTIEITNESAATWLPEAALRHLNKPESVSKLSSLPVIFPFQLDLPLSYLASRSEHLDLRSDGSRNQFVALALGR